MTGGVFGAVAKCIKNLDSSGDPPLLEKVMEELKKVDGKRDTHTTRLPLNKKKEKESTWRCQDESGADLQRLTVLRIIVRMDTLLSIL